MDNYNLQLMTHKLVLVIMLVMLMPSLAKAQNNSVSVQDDTPIDYKDTWKSPYITDEMTLDPEQNKSWRMGEYKFSSKPKNSWEFGIHLGHFMISGDVDKNLFGGYGVGLHLRKALNYTLSIRSSLMYGVATGMEMQPTRHKNNTGADGIGGGLVEQVFSDYDPMRGGPGEWFPAYRTTYVSGDIAAIFNIGNILFHRERNKWNLYFGLGIGLNTHKAMLDLLNSNGLPYDALSERINWSLEEFDTKSGRSRIKSELQTIYDGDYETEGPQKAGIFRLGDEMNVHMSVIPSFGLTRKLNKRINMGIEHSVYLADTDYLDGVKYRTSVDQSNNLDVAHYTQVRIGINLGNFKKVTEPLYWINPVDQAYSDIADLKSRESLDFADEDNDGVIDLLDQELGTPEDCPVDTRGIILDSDGDGIVDCEDKEPYSRPGCPVDAVGVAQCDDVQNVDEEQVRAIVADELKDFTPVANQSTSTPEMSSGLVLNEDGSRSFSTSNGDGSETRTMQYPDGLIESVTNYKDGAVTTVKEAPDGRVEAEFVNSLGEISTVISDTNGTKTTTKNNPDGSVTRNVLKPDGELESFTKYEDGSTRRTIRHTDGTLVSDTKNADGSTNTTTQGPEGIIKSRTQNLDGSIVLTVKDTSGLITKEVSYPDGTRRSSVLDHETGDLTTDIDKPDGTRVSVIQRPDGVLVERTNYPDGSYRKITRYTNGEITEEFLDAEGIMTNRKERPDGSQRIVVSNDEGIISDTEVASEEAERIIVSEKSYGIFAPDIPEIETVELDIPETPDFPQETVADNTPVPSSSTPAGVVTVLSSECGDWFLPMIHFDLNRFSIKPQYYSHLHNVADVMRKCPDVCVVAQGHTDTRHTNDYNTVLSYRRAKSAVDYLVNNYGIDRSRIKLMYGGEDAPMVMSASSEAQHFMNRRVEFRTCETGDRDMAAPPAYDRIQQNESLDKVYKQGVKASGY